jgi:hypothetical protein
MAFSIAAGLAGFAKRGMQFNDEQRQLTNDNIKTAVNLVATDALEQRKARKTLKANYKTTAQSLDSLGLNGAQIEAAYARFGNDAGTEIGNALKAHTIAWTDQRQRDGLSTEWTKNDTINWLKKTVAVPDDAVSRPIDVQAASYADTFMPQTTADFGQLAQNIVAGSGEITMRPSDRRADAIRNQMQASFQAASGGIQETQPGAVFNASRGTVNLQADPTAVLDFQTKQATTQTAQNTSTITGAEAKYADQKGELQIEALTTRNLLDKDNLAFLKEQQPLLLEQLQGRIKGQDLANTLAKATQGDQIAQAELNTALLVLKEDSAALDVRLKELKLEQDPQLFAMQMEQLGLSIQGATFDNIIKKNDASTVAIRASLGLQLQRIQVEQGGLRTTLLGEQITGEQNKNALAGVNEEILDQRLALLKEQVADAQTPATFQAAILEIDGALQDVDPSDPEYDQLIESKDNVLVSLAMYTEASTRDTASTDPKFGSLTSAFNTSLKTKLNQKGLGGNVMFLSDNSVKWQGDEAARTEFDTVVNRHRAIYAMSIRGFEQGPQAIQALDLNFANLPMTEVPTGPPTMYQTAGQFQSVPDITIDNVGDVFRTKMFSSDGTEQLVQILEDKNKPGEVIFDTIDS